MKSQFLFCVLLISLIHGGCNKPRVEDKIMVGAEERLGVVEMTPPELEVVWVDPAVVSSDQFMTLIRADRLDSVQLPQGEIVTAPAPAIAFDIVDQPCLTSIRMLDSRGTVLQSLLTKTLPSGHYKLTLHKPPPAANPNIPYNYSLEAVYCGQTKMERITSGWTGRR